MDQPRISVVIACYNGQAWLDGCLESLVAQTRPADEIIVADDGSTDRSAEILGGWQGKLPNLRVIRQANAGAAAARNRAIEAAKGDLLAILDVDDRFEREKLDLQADFMQRFPEIDVGFTDFTTVGESGQVVEASGLGGHPLMWRQDWRKVGEGLHISQGTSLEWMVRDSFVHPSTAMLRRSTVEKFGLFDEGIRYVEDHEYFVRCLKGGAKLGLLHRSLSRMTLTATSCCRGNMDTFRWRVRLLNHYERTYRGRLTPAERTALHDVRREYLLGLAYHLGRDGQYAEARRYAAEAFRNGGGWPAMKYWLKTLPGIRAAVPSR